MARVRYIKKITCSDKFTIYVFSTQRKKYVTYKIHKYFRKDCINNSLNFRFISTKLHDTVNVKKKNIR